MEEVIEECRTAAELLTKAADLAEYYKAEAELAQRNIELQRKNTLAFMIERDSLMQAFRYADGVDWEKLFLIFPDDCNGRFWKSVLLEFKTALENIPKPS